MLHDVAVAAYAGHRGARLKLRFSRNRLGRATDNLAGELARLRQRLVPIFPEVCDVFVGVVVFVGVIGPELFSRGDHLEERVVWIHAG